MDYETVNLITGQPSLEGINPKLNKGINQDNLRLYITEEVTHGNKTLPSGIGNGSANHYQR
jgi:hypothetical protein